MINSGSIIWLSKQIHVTWSLHACPISKSLRFSSVLNFRVATKILLQNLFRFYFCVPFSSIKSYNKSCKVFSRSEQETGKRKHKEPPSIREAKKFHSLHRFRYNSSPSELARVTVSRPYRRLWAPGAILITNMYPLDPGVNGWVPVQDIYSLASGRERNLCMTLPSQCRLSGCGSRSYIAQLWGFHPGVQWNLKICSIEKCPQLCI